MFATGLIVFREVIEAALIIGIVMAAARGVAGRGLWVGTGIGMGLLGALMVAAFAEVISSALAGMGQEVFNASVLFTAVLMLGWHNVWMKKHGRELASHVGGVSRAVTEGSRPLYALAVVVGLAILREGSEVVLFVTGIATAEGSQATSMLFGGLLGLAAGITFGLAMYLGLLRIPTRHLFTVTSWLILLLAAGMAAQGAHYLVQANLLPALGNAVWNTDVILSEHSILGQVMKTLVGYVARPDGIQVVFYIATLLLIGSAMLWVGRPPRRTEGHAVALLTAVLLGALIQSNATDARAAHKVYSPIVEKGELELEARGHVLKDDDEETDGAHKDKFEIGYGITSRWFSSVFAEYVKEGDEAYQHEATAWENIFQLTEQGQYWLDAGLYAEYEFPRDNDAADKLELKLLLEKNVGRWTHTANLIAESEVGSGADGEVAAGYAWRTKYRWRPQLEPALELYGDLGHSGRFGIHDDQSYQMGPVILGHFRLSPKLSLGYELGYLIGLTDASPDSAFKWLLELEARI